MKISNVKLYGGVNAVIKAGYPMASDVNEYLKTATVSDRIRTATALAQAKQGSGHDNLLKGVIVQMDLTASLASWKQFQRYHWFDFVSSTSTMHRIKSMDIDSQCNIFVDDVIKKRLKELIMNYNYCLDKYGNGDIYTKRAELQMMYNIPTGFELTASMTTNYQQLKTMYHQRKNHKLPDWHMFKEWVETLPNSHWITLNKNADNVPLAEDYMELEDFDGGIYHAKYFES